MRICAYDHVGLRVTVAARSLTFYEALGFHIDKEHSTQTALEIVNVAGVRLVLILNGEPTPQRDNVCSWTGPINGPATHMQPLLLPACRKY